MKRMIAIACAAALTATSVLAQDSGKPADFAKLDKLIGNWEGTGKFYPPGGGEGEGWTSTGTCQWILGGKFMLEDTCIKMSMGSIIFRTLYGWDPERKVVFSHQISNMGMGGPGELHWQDDNTMLVVAHGVEGGMPYVERTISHLDKGSFVMSRAMGDAELSVFVEGASKKGGPGFNAASKEGNIALMPPGTEAAVLTRMAGNYAMNGKASPPGGESKPVTSKITVESILGGQAIVTHVLPGGGRPESFGHGFWDANNNCYSYFTANADGRYVPYRAKLVGKDNLVFMASYTDAGTPMVERFQLGLNGDGSPKSLALDVISGTAPVARLAEGTYAREGGGGAKPIEAKFSEGSCCAKALAAGKACTHPCCVEATAAGKVCTACNR